MGLVCIAIGFMKYVSGNIFVYLAIYLKFFIVSVFDDDPGCAGR